MSRETTRWKTRLDLRLRARASAKVESTNAGIHQTDADQVRRDIEDQLR